MAKRRKATLKLEFMDFDSLMALRNQVQHALGSYRNILEKQLAALGGSITSVGRGRHALAGKKVKPKYRDNAGNTWAGRGQKPRWLVAAIKEGKSLENFLINKSAATRKKTKTKRAKKRRTKK